MKKFTYSAFVLLVAAMAWVLPAEGAELADPAKGWRELWGHLMWDLWIVGIIFGSITIYFMYKYKRKSDNEAGTAKPLSMSHALVWAIVPSFIFLADDFWLAAGGFKLWIDQRTVPENAMEVKVTGQMWSWDFEYENGAESDEEEGLVVPVGTPVVLRMQSEDTIHGFFIPDFRIKEDLMPGRVTFIWFNPTKIGEHVFTCTEYCGTEHSNMYGKVKVVSQSEFDKWSEEHQG